MSLTSEQIRRLIKGLAHCLRSKGYSEDEAQAKAKEIVLRQQASRTYRRAGPDDVQIVGGPKP